MRSDPGAQNIGWFKREFEDDALDLSPSFQRRPLWDDEQASYLIDSILNDFPIPEVYIRSTSTPEGKTVHEVVDGQQRLRSIIKFFQNDLELFGPEVSADLTGLQFEDLEESEKTKFWAYKLAIRQLEATDVEIKEIFRRLNLNVVELNDAELRNADLEGDFISLVEDLADDPWWVDRGIVTVKEIRRMLDVEYVSELLVGLMAGPQDKKKTLDDFYYDYDADFPEASQWRRRFVTTRDVVEDILEDDIRRWRSKSEFYSLFLAVGEYVYEGVRFSASEIAAIQKSLKGFRTKVDAAKKRDNEKDYGVTVHSYADAVTRAASDLSRRVTRIDVIKGIIDKARRKAA